MKGCSWLLTAVLTAVCFMTAWCILARETMTGELLPEAGAGSCWIRFSAGNFKSTNGPIRLWRNGTAGNSYTEFTSGRVQLVYDSEWGNICWDANFGLTEADVICHQLGYAGALDYSRASHDE